MGGMILVWYLGMYMFMKKYYFISHLIKENPESQKTV